MERKTESSDEQKSARKRAAAIRAVDYIENNTAVGLGTGSTARFVAEEIAARLQSGALSGIVCVPTSEGTRQLAEELGIPLTTLEEKPRLSVAIDGADEVDPTFTLIKGAGGALLREKIVAAAADKFVVVIDDSKLVTQLGEQAAVPIEVVKFGWSTHLEPIKQLGGTPVLRKSSDGSPFITDEGHYILDSRFDSIADAAALEQSLLTRPGVVDTGLFLNMADVVVVGAAGGVEIKQR